MRPNLAVVPASAAFGLPGGLAGKCRATKANVFNILKKSWSLCTAPVDLPVVRSTYK
jgi:hypothetical protein